MKKEKIITLGLFIVLLGISVGCKNSSDTVTPNSTSSNVDLSAGFSTIGSSTSLLKTAAVDSLRIDSIVAVFQRIKFESHIETTTVDTTGNDTTVTDAESNYTFKGPFVIHIRDSNAVSFANQILPTGVYTGIKFKIHTFHKGEKCEDSDERNHRMMTSNNDPIVGYSIAVWGSIKQNGVWVPFAFKSDIEVEFKLTGNFTVAVSTNSVNMALRFKTGDWFKDLNTGAMLDPTNTSRQNIEMINQAIKRSFEKGHGGRDSNGDGHPDDY